MSLSKHIIEQSQGFYDEYRKACDYDVETAIRKIEDQIWSHHKNREKHLYLQHHTEAQVLGNQIDIGRHTIVAMRSQKANQVNSTLESLRKHNLKNVDPLLNKLTNRYWEIENQKVFITVQISDRMITGPRAKIKTNLKDALQEQLNISTMYYRLKSDPVEPLGKLSREVDDLVGDKLPHLEEVEIRELSLAETENLKNYLGKENRAAFSLSRDTALDGIVLPEDILKNGIEMITNLENRKI